MAGGQSYRREMECLSLLWSSGRGAYLGHVSSFPDYLWIIFELTLLAAARSAIDDVLPQISNLNRQERK